jgi:hypothetical protein
MRICLRPHVNVTQTLQSMLLVIKRRFFPPELIRLHVHVSTLCLFTPRRHVESGGIAPLIITLSKMEVNGQLYIQIELFPWKLSPVLIAQEVVWASESV